MSDNITQIINKPIDGIPSAMDTFVPTQTISQAVKSLYEIAERYQAIKMPVPQAMSMIIYRATHEVSSSISRMCDAMNNLEVEVKKHIKKEAKGD